ncbi:hypothetical protein LCGC14_2582670 [marine sediment metagenome]|uniref:Uncharacterized protein n=1 Tax=marine sediment metagenome TaxID=412755 RepID=A0A0F9D6S1_9ZZZZ
MNKRPTSLIPRNAPDDFATEEAWLFCQNNPDWLPIPKGEFNRFVCDQIDAGVLMENSWPILNERRQLRPDHHRGTPRWDRSSFARCVKAMNHDLSFSDIRVRRRRDRQAAQLSLPVKTTKANEREFVETNDFSELWVVDMDLANLMVTIEITEWVPTRVTRTLPLHDPLAAKALKNGWKPKEQSSGPVLVKDLTDDQSDPNEYDI